MRPGEYGVPPSISSMKKSYSSSPWSSIHEGVWVGCVYGFLYEGIKGCPWGSGDTFPRDVEVLGVAGPGGVTTEAPERGWDTYPSSKKKSSSSPSSS